jgi:hypothetical protein
MARRSKPIDIPEPKTYVLDKNGNPVHEPDMVKWGAFLMSNAKCLKQDALPNGTCVSTVFIGVDYRSPPRLWETMIFGGAHDEYQYRYTSREDALAGHEKALALASGDDLLANAQGALEKLVSPEASRRLARLGGTMPDLNAPRRRRVEDHKGRKK